MRGLLRYAADALRGGIEGGKDAKAQKLKIGLMAQDRGRKEQDRQRDIERDMLEKSILDFNFQQAQERPKQQATAAAKEAQELAALRDQDPSFANLSRDAIEKILEERAKPKKAELPQVVPGSAEDLRIRKAQATATGEGANEAMANRESGAMKTKIASNKTQIGNIDRALAKVDAYPEGLGAWNYIGDRARQETDPEGVDVRSEIANIGSMIYHDRSGAAVSVSESKRLQPFIPAATDNPAAIRDKLRNLRRILAEETGYLDKSGTVDKGPSDAGRAAARAALKARS